MPTLAQFKLEVAELLSSEDMVAALEAKGMRHEVAHRIANSSGVKASQSLRGVLRSPLKSA